MTAVEWLYNELSKNNMSTDSVIERINKESSIWKQAIEMEKQQIIEAHGIKENHGWKNGQSWWQQKSGEQYYNETYKNDKI